MAFSTAPNPPSARPTARPLRRQHSQPALWAVAFISFLLGSAATTLAIWQLNNLYKATVAPLVAVEGTMRAQYGYQGSEGLQPPPSGYYVESPGVERVYLTGKEALEPFVGKPIVARGSVSGVCGPKALPCYTQLEIRKISIPVEDE